MLPVARRLTALTAVAAAALLVGGAVSAAAAAPTAPAASPSPSTSAPPPADSPWVTGYYAGWYWDQGYAPDQVDMHAMTHFVFGRVAPGGGSLGGVPGGIVLGAGTAHDLDASPYPGVTVEDAAIGFAHDAGAKALLMLGGDGFDGRGFVASADDAVRAEFVENLVDYLVAHDYDGVDVDWENCIGGEAWECGIDITVEESARRLTALLADIRAEMATRPRYATEPGLITFPGYAVKTNELDEHGHVEQWRVDIALLVDQYNLMSYGIGTTWNGAGWQSWFSGALDGEGEGRPVSIDASIDAYVASGVPRDRIGMGIGFFGIYYGPTITGPRQDTEEAGNDIYETDDNALGYAYLSEMGYFDHGVRHFDDEASSTYRVYDGGYIPAGDPARVPAGMLSYEDEQSIAAKGAYTRAGGAAGTIVWTLNYGALPDGSNPLLEAVGEAFLAGSPTAPDAVIRVPDAPASGWFDRPVSVEFEGIDQSGSGIDHLEISVDGSAPLVVGGATHTREVAGDGAHRVTLTVVDAEGGTTTTRATVRIDASAPTVDIRSPAGAASLAPGELAQGSEVRAEFACADPHSGVASCAGDVANGARIDTAELGAHEFTVTATNGAGLVETRTVSYRVVEAPPAPAPPAAPALASTGGAWGAPLAASLLLVALGVIALFARRHVSGAARR